jgi:hypothetical protein
LFFSQYLDFLAIRIIQCSPGISEGFMTKKPIDRLYGLPLVLILLLGLAKYLDLFPVPSWVFACILAWGAIAVAVEVIRQRKKG